MNFIRHYFTCITTICLICLCSCASRDSTRPALPDETGFNQDAGRGGYVRLQLHLDDGEQLNCTLDTGSSFTVLARSSEPKLGTRIGTTYISGFRGVRTNGVYLSPKLYLGKTPLLIGPQTLTDKMEDGAAFWGMDSLRHYCFQLDFTANKIRFLDPDHLDTNGLGTAFAITLSHDNHVILHKNLLGVKKWVIDIGAPTDAAMTAQDFGRALRDQHVVPMTDGLKNKRQRGACFPKAQFGGNTYSNLFIKEVPQDFEDLPNIIGLNFLARHLVTFNFPKRMMYLKQVTAEPLNFGHFLSLEANTFLESLDKKDQLPGRSKGKQEIDWISEAGDSEAFPVSRTLKFQIGGWLDVTPKIKSLAAGGAAPLQISVNSGLAGRDPAPSIVKQLRVHFRLKGQDLVAEAAEGETLDLPAGSEVVAAYYGNLLGEPDDPSSQHRDVSAYHYTVVKESRDSPWKLQKSWRTDAKEAVVEEYPAP